MRLNAQDYADVLVLAIKSELAPIHATQAHLRVQHLELQERHDLVLKELGQVRERLAAIEARPLLPGPPGEPGPAGADGNDGKDGVPGLAFKGTYKDDHTYSVGEIVRWGGSTYVCQKQTTGLKPDAVAFRGANGKDFWELFVSKGDPGKAAK